MLMRYSGQVQVKNITREASRETGRKLIPEEHARVDYSDKSATGKPLEELSVEELVEQIRQGNAEALGQVYDRYSGRVYAFLLKAVERELAEELLQDVFVALWQKAGLYDPARGSFNAWFFTLVRRRLYDALPRYQRHRNENSLSASNAGGEGPYYEQADSGHDLEEQILRLFRDAEVRQALQHLPAEQRHIILMTYFGGLSQRELAEQLQVPVSTIKGRARMGLQRLRQLLPEQL